MARLTATDRRERILTAAIEEMRDRGFAGATTRDVAARLGVGRGLLHHYFDSWEVLQREAFRALATEAQAAAEAALVGVASRHRILALMEMMLAKPAEAHVRLYSDAWGQAQVDPALADIYAEVMAWWRNQVHATILTGIADGSIACGDPAASAERLTALSDGLSSYILLAHAGMPWERARDLLHGAIALELGPACLAGA